MSELAATFAPITVQEYFALEEKTPLKHEYLDGLTYAMVGASIRHNLITVNLAVALRANRPRGCDVFVSDVKLRIRLAAAEFYYYPDVLVSCSATDRHPLYREEPALIVEVASPSTIRIDRGEKLNRYREIPSLQEYVIVGQDEPAVEVYRRRADWTRQMLAPTEGLTLESVGITLGRSEIYEGVEF
jgi:Uma2 family endonuclease